MGTQNIVLTGCKRFNFEGKLYVDKGDDGKTQVVYEVEDKTAEHLLAQFERETGYNYFEEYKGDAKAVKAKAEDEEKARPAPRRRPQQNERFRATERTARGPKPAPNAGNAKPGHESTPIDDEAVEV